MSFFELAKARFSVRSYQSRPIEQDKLDLILEAGQVAPTACNNQPQKIYVAKSKESRDKLAGVCGCTFDAPVILVICCDREQEWKNRLMPGYGSGETDAAIVCTHMMLQAWELGVGSCWVGFFNADEVAKTLDLPEHLTVCALLPMGYAAEDTHPAPPHTQRKAMEETVAVI